MGCQQQDICEVACKGLLRKGSRECTLCCQLLHFYISMRLQVVPIYEEIPCWTLLPLPQLQSTGFQQDCTQKIYDALL